LIDGKRIRQINNKTIIRSNDCFIYWLQHSQRTHFNHALEYSIELANRFEKPLLVYFGITDSFPGANPRHYRFMLEGLMEVEKNLFERGIRFVCELKSPEIGVLGVSQKACAIVTDRGYLRIEKDWRKKVSENLECAMFEVETDLIVPLEEASLKEEYAAYTIRKKINSRLLEFLVPLEEEQINIKSSKFKFGAEETVDLEDLLKKYSIEDNLSPVEFKGGTSNAVELLEIFIKNKLSLYNDKRNDPSLEFTSNLSSYLHFGQISPIYIGLRIGQIKGEGTEAFLEEMIIRRELSFNFVNYNPYYDSFDSLPNWAQITLLEHENDNRPYIYSKEELENSLTHDRYWNAAQLELVLTGKMHGYMRMYWGKKIIEWTTFVRDAFDTALYLNNKYALDGRDPNSFSGVAWCFGKHDRPWKERPVFGKIRYMNSNGLKRKFNPDLYADKIYSMLP